MKKFSRLLVLPAALFVANVSAKCPLFDNRVVKPIGEFTYNNKFALGAGLTLSDHLCHKDEHFKKAFIDTLGHSVDQLSNKSFGAEQFIGHLATNYTVRRVKEAANVDGYVDMALKKCDVVPEGMVRNNVNAAERGAAHLATLPETMTLAALALIAKYTQP